MTARTNVVKANNRFLSCGSLIALAPRKSAVRAINAISYAEATEIIYNFDALHVMEVIGGDNKIDQ